LHLIQNYFISPSPLPNFILGLYCTV